MTQCLTIKMNVSGNALNRLIDGSISKQLMGNFMALGTINQCHYPVIRIKYTKSIYWHSVYPDVIVSRQIRPTHLLLPKRCLCFPLPSWHHQSQDKSNSGLGLVLHRCMSLPAFAAGCKIPPQRIGRWYLKQVYAYPQVIY